MNAGSLGFRLNVGDAPMPLGFLIAAFERNELVLPDFQRAFIWNDSKIRSWVNTLTKGTSYGSICTYQITQNNNPTSVFYLNDGRQRIGATIRFLENPSRYGVDASTDEVRRALNYWTITVQHRHFQSHDEALLAFQNLNMGTAAHPAEYYKGEITKTRIGNWLYEELIKVLDSADARATKASASTPRETGLKMQRDALALFLQYVTNARQKSFWNVETRVVDALKDNPVERYVHDFIKGKDQHEIESLVRSFRKFIEQETALIEQLTFETTNQLGAKLSNSFFRGFLHLAVYRRNMGWSVQEYCEVVRAALTYSETLNARIILPPTEKTQAFSINLGLGDLSKIGRMCRHLNLPFAEDKPARKKTGTAGRGYDNSHLLPFVDYGDGATVPEPAALNRARGAKVMKKRPDAPDADGGVA